MRSTTADHQQQPVAAEVGGTQPAKAVKVGAAQQGATVNGTAITGRQLLAWRAGAPAEQEMTAEMFGALRTRAIERELTFQEARSKQIELGAAQLDQFGRAGDDDARDISVRYRARARRHRAGLPGIVGLGLHGHSEGCAARDRGRERERAAGVPREIVAVIALQHEPKAGEAGHRPPTLNTLVRQITCTSVTSSSPAVPLPFAIEHTCVGFDGWLFTATT